MQGTILNDRWEIQEALGKGATGTVFKGRDLKEGTTVAIKRVERKHLSKKQVADLMGELELLQQFRHPNIVRIIDHCNTKRELCFVLEYMDNGSLTHMLRKFGRFPENVVAAYTQQILHGLNYLHSHNVVHRDIKGDNILISGDSRICLADFGLARRIDPEAATPISEEDELDHQVEGTTFWLAPEVILMSGQTVVSDIWSLGSTIIELLTGNPPYSQYSAMGAIFHIVKDDHPPFPKGISSNLEGFLSQCFDKDVTSRPPASELLKHPWIPQVSKPLNALELRNSLKDYNRRPTVIAAPVVSEIEVDQTVDLITTESVEKEVQMLQNLAASDTKKLRLMEVLEKMTTKLDILEKKISKRHAADENLAKLSHIYGKWLKDYKHNCEKQHKINNEQLVHDISAKDSLKKELLNLKRSAFPVAITTEDITTDSTHLRSGDVVFVIADCNALTNCGLSLSAFNHPTSCCCIVECMDAGHITRIPRDKIQITDNKSPKEALDTTENKSYLDSRLTLDVESAEKLLHSIQNQNKKDKLGGFFGASSSEIDQGLRQSNNRTLVSPTSPRTEKFGVSSPSIFRKSYDIMKGLHLTRASFVSIPVQTEAILHLIDNTTEGHHEDSLLFLIEIQEHQDLLKQASLVRCGILGVAVGSTEDETGSTELLKQRCLFLFDNNNLVVAKKKLRWPNDENYFHIKHIIPLSEGKLIYVSTLDNSNEKVGHARFQIFYKDIGFTFFSDNGLMPSADAELESWFQCLKVQVKQLQKERITRLTISSSSSPIPKEPS